MSHRFVKSVLGLTMLAAAALAVPSTSEAFWWPGSGWGGPGWGGPGWGGPGWGGYAPYGYPYNPWYGPGYGYGYGHPGYGYGYPGGWGSPYGYGAAFTPPPGAMLSPQQIQSLKAGLGVKPNQEAAWNDLVAAVRNLKPGESLSASKSVQKAYDTLLAQLDPEQKKKAESFKASIIW
ncbi:MAG: hypothetical protein HQL56_12160 [Magnetococcales bacterium]|nr:hypothetical protein [Magnetococcales bacterium]